MSWWYYGKLWSFTWWYQVNLNHSADVCANLTSHEELQKETQEYVSGVQVTQDNTSWYYNNKYPHIIIHHDISLHILSHGNKSWYCPNKYYPRHTMASYRDSPLLSLFCLLGLSLIVLEENPFLLFLLLDSSFSTLCLLSILFGFRN